ncbi:MAG: hypothetical protein HYX53_10280 [Chloroflexi bacterium]|nr:hypothetical protein [Chloroflexota bacterium]
MRGLFLLLFGISVGIVGTVLFTTLDPSFQGDERETAGGGNARFSLDEDALATIIKRNISDLPGMDAAKVRTTIKENGTVAVAITIGAGGLAVTGTLVVDPDVVDGQLKMNVVSGSLGNVAVPDEIVQRIEQPLQDRLRNLAGGAPYRLTSIATADRRLTLEIAI